MAIKFKYFLLIIFVFGFTHYLCAQSPGSYIDTRSGEGRYMQRFVWTSDYASMYEVVFYRLENGAYVPFIQEFTAQNFIELSLPVGSYCFLIIPYDVFDKPGEPSEWKYIDILPVPGTEEAKDIEPEPVPELEEEIKPEPQKEPEIFIEPVIEVEAEPEPQRLKTFLVNFSYAWMPIIPTYGYEYGTEMSLISINGRIGAAVRLPVNLYLGLEFSLIQDYEITNITAGLNLFALKWFPGEKAALGAKFGAAIPPFMNKGEYYIGNVGLFFRFLMSKNNLFEIGIDACHIFEKDASGCLRPWIGFGYQL